MRMRAMNGQVVSKPTQRRYSPELKERAVRMERDVLK
jgi:transposase-like protein